MPKREREMTGSSPDSPTSSVGATSLRGPVSSARDWSSGRCCGLAARIESAEVRGTTGTGSARGLNKMKTRQLGTLRSRRSAQAPMSISANYGPPADRAEGIKVLREAHHRGVTFFDTAEVYRPYSARRLSAKRSHPFATACGSRRSSDSTSKAALVVSTAAPSTSRQSSMARSSASAPTASISCTSIGSIRTSRSKTSPVRSKS